MPLPPGSCPPQAGLRDGVALKGEMRHSWTNPYGVKFHEISGPMCLAQLPLASGKWRTNQAGEETLGSPGSSLEPLWAVKWSCHSTQMQSRAYHSAGAAKRPPMRVSALVGKHCCFLKGLSSVLLQASPGGCKEMHFKTFHFNLMPFSTPCLCYITF